MVAEDALGAQFKYESPSERHGTSSLGYGHHSLQISIRAPFDVGQGGGQHLRVTPKGEMVPAGELVWQHPGGKILRADVTGIFQRRGVGTAMFEEAQRLASENPKIPQPRHSNDRTDAGDAWARKVGGRLPRRKKDVRYAV